MIVDQIDRPVTHRLGWTSKITENIAVVSDCQELVPYQRQVRLAVGGSRARYHNPPVDSIGR